MATSNETESSTMSFTSAKSHLIDLPASQVKPNSTQKAKVVGLYGIPGCGKTHLLDQLRLKFKGDDRFSFTEGSTKIYNLVDEGVKAFQSLQNSEREAWFANRGLKVFQDLKVLKEDHHLNQRGCRVFQSLGESEKELWRKFAIDNFREEARDSKRVTVVAGHFSFWAEGMAQRKVHTLNDLQTYALILYVDVDPGKIGKRITNDNESGARFRKSASDDHLRRWQEAEKAELRDLCQKNNILFALLPPQRCKLERSMTLLKDFWLHDEMRNLSCAETEMDRIVRLGCGKYTTMLVMDADKTLAAEDTGKLFWSFQGEQDPLQSLFSSPLAYSYNAFRQATLLYEEIANDGEFNGLCQKVALKVRMYPEFVSLLQILTEAEHVGAVIVTCGLKLVWEKVLMRENLAQRVKIIGGGRLSDSLVVTEKVKAALVIQLRDLWKLRVYAFGDGPLDLAMLKEADKAVIVVGEEGTRSKSMDAKLEEAIDGGFRARQVLLPRDVDGISPRSDLVKLPEVDLTAQDFVSSMFDHPNQTNNNRVLRLRVLQNEDDGAAKLLTTPMRDAKVAGPELREAHRNTGRYLATKYLTNLIGLEEYQAEHVLGRPTSGFQLFHEEKTLIVAMMRGGEPMAFGVNDAFPRAMILHVNVDKDLTPRKLEGRQTIVVVDSVVNTGTTIVDFVKHVRSLHATIQIVIVAGVVQDKFPSSGQLDSYANLSMVALRLSNTQFKGKGTNDTGNRLFNTTHLD